MRVWDVIAVLMAALMLTSAVIIASIKIAEKITTKVDEWHNEPENPEGQPSEESEPPEVHEPDTIDNYPDYSYDEPFCSPSAEWYLINAGKLINCSTENTRKSCIGGTIVSYEGTCRDGSCTSIEIDEQPCEYCRTTEAFWTRSDAICLQNPESNVLVLICGRDNEENACCCYIPTHTYLFDSPKHIGNAEIRYKTGLYARCDSEINVYVIDENDDRTLVTTLEGIGHKMLMASLDLSRYGKIKGIVLDEGADCYLGRSALILEVLPE